MRIYQTHRWINASNWLCENTCQDHRARDSEPTGLYLLGQHIVRPQCSVDEVHIFQSVVTQSPPIATPLGTTVCSMGPASCDMSVVQRPESQTPAFQNDKLNRLLTVRIDLGPLSLRLSVSLAVECAFIVAGDASFVPGTKRSYNRTSEGKIMG